MEELNPAEAIQGARQLTDEWWESLRSEFRSSLPLEAVAGSFAHYVPYVLATIFYGCEVMRLAKKDHQDDSAAELLESVTSEAVDRLIQFVPREGMTKDTCKKALDAVVRPLAASGDSGRYVVAAETISNRLFNLLKEHDPSAGDRERGLVTYIVTKELAQRMQ